MLTPEEMGKSPAEGGRWWKDHPLIEPLLIFAAFYLPGYLGQGTEVDGTIFNSIWYDLTYIAYGVPQFALIVYIISKRSGDSVSSFGIRFPEKSDLPLAGMAFLLIWLAVVPILILEAFLDNSGNGSSVTWSIHSPMILPLLCLVCVVTGYVEELYFRAYLLTVLPKAGLTAGYTVAASSLLFGAGHLYQGLAGFAATSVIGLVLSFWYLRHRSLHAVALAHGLYNFTNLTLTLIIDGPM